MLARLSCEKFARARRRAFWPAAPAPPIAPHTQLDLREAHAAARDAVRAELNLRSRFRRGLRRRNGICSRSAPQAHDQKTNTCCARTSAGTSTNASRAEIAATLPARAEIFKSPSATAFRSPRSPRKFRRFCRCFIEGAEARGWTVGSHVRDPPLPRGHSERNRRTAEPASRRPADRRAPRPRHRGKPSAYMAYRPQRRSHRREPQPDLEYSRARREPAVLPRAF